MSTQSEITLSSQDLAEHFWVQDGLHFSRPLTPLFASYMIPAISDGTQRAMAALKGPVRQFIGKVHDGYYYQAVIPLPGDPKDTLYQHQNALKPFMSQQSAQMKEIVDSVLMPLHQEITDWANQPLDDRTAIQALIRLQEIYLTFWEWHFRIVVPRMAAGFRFEETYHQAFPSHHATDAYDLLLGVMNKSLETDRALWLLAQEAKTRASVRRALEANDFQTALQNDPEAQSFQQSLSDFLEVYGWRSVNSHEFVDETWIERPDYCITIIKGYIEQDFDFDHHWTRVVQQRAQHLDEILTQISDQSMRSQFIAAYQDALDAWPIDEDHHFYIDAMLPARARYLCLNVAKHLQNKGILSRPDDIFFLFLDEVLSLLTDPNATDPSTIIAERRTLYQQQLKNTPIPQLGTAPDAPRDPDLLLVRVFGDGSPAIGMEGPMREVRGFAASRGRYRGPVRIIHGPHEFFKVKPGDVLVCRSTAPSWTGLFGIAGAIVTETGGILSHAATVAREYQIPCIVGTRNATHVFHEGDIVLVDGTLGTAIIDG
ncbi:PEP-utilizing enzyme [Sulfobacillus thermosulfidooxidans]|uniref:PEP-utilizing enzyme n=1 Tax=Sulfobacillus thermosulfidooxidans TaxID=28034 RepID=UPI0006B4264E|nr:PEP-utilizing enzyme [Sulfobacillus thermosulfidooxidans]